MNKINITLLVTLCIFIFSACKEIKDQKTTLEVKDNNRHYYPILQGQELDIAFPIKNTGKNPFMLTDIFTSCGCLIPKKASIQTIPPGQEGTLILKYNSTKNVGLVQHYITLYGNFATTDKIEIMFDVHVVPNALYTKDYEELYQERKDKEGRVEDMVDGDENNKGYYMDEDL